MGELQQQNASLWEEAQRGLALAASLTDMYQKIQVRRRQLPHIIF